MFRIPNVALSAHARTVLPPRATAVVSVSLADGAKLVPGQKLGTMTCPTLGKGRAVVAEDGTVKVVWDELPPSAVGC